MFRFGSCGSFLARVAIFVGGLLVLFVILVGFGFVACPWGFCFGLRVGAERFGCRFVDPVIGLV